MYAAKMLFYLEAISWKMIVFSRSAFQTSTADPIFHHLSKRTNRNDSLRVSIYKNWCNIKCKIVKSGNPLESKYAQSLLDIIFFCLMPFYAVCARIYPIFESSDWTRVILVYEFCAVALVAVAVTMTSDKNTTTTTKEIKFVQSNKSDDA